MTVWCSSDSLAPFRSLRACRFLATRDPAFSTLKTRSAVANRGL
jgi:hypothetical protein